MSQEHTEDIVDPVVDPDAYPVRCDCTQSQLETLVARYDDPEDDFGERARGWPPTDPLGNVYPIFFTPDELNDHGNLQDSFGTDYRPFTGNLTVNHDENCCNAPLNNWRDRYPQLRFCGRTIYGDHRTYCNSHHGKTTVMNDSPTAEEALQSGLQATTLDHYYERLDPLQRLFGWGTFESLMGDSAYDFAVEYLPREFDFSEAAFVPPTIDVDENGVATIRCGYPTEKGDRAVMLYAAAMMSVQIISVQPKIMAADEDGQGMMEERTTEYAQLTAPPSDHDPSPQEFQTLESWSEHHLNLPLSRIIRDRQDLLEYGGVTTDPEDDTEEIGGDDIVLEIEADPDSVETTDGGTDPNAFENYEAASEEILEHTEE